MLNLYYLLHNNKIVTLFNLHRCGGRFKANLIFSTPPPFSEPWRNFRCSLSSFLFAGSSFIGGVKLVAAPSQNLCVATPGPGGSHNVGLEWPLTPDANACVTKANPKPSPVSLCIFEGSIKWGKRLLARCVWPKDFYFFFNYRPKAL